MYIEVVHDSILCKQSPIPNSANWPLSFLHVGLEQIFMICDSNFLHLAIFTLGLNPLYSHLAGPRLRTRWMSRSN